MDIDNKTECNPDDVELEGKALADKVREIFGERPTPHYVLQEDICV